MATFYKMKMVFSLDVSNPDLNSMTEILDGGRLIVKDAMELSIEQTLPCVPTPEHIAKYEESLKRTQLNSRTIIEKAHFIRYDYLTPIEVG